MKLMAEEQRSTLHMLYAHPTFYGGDALARVIELVGLGLAERCDQNGEPAYRLSAVGKHAKALPENEPEWLRRQSPTERATSAAPWARTEQDYLAIVAERPGVSFGEYDDIKLLMDMVSQGLLVLDAEKKNVVSGLVTSIHPILTDAGRKAMERA